MRSDGKACRKTLLNGFDQGCPGKRIGPLTDRMGVRDKIGDLEAGAASGQPVLEVV
jgi:hypothetical protein